MVLTTIKKNQTILDVMANSVLLFSWKVVPPSCHTYFTGYLSWATVTITIILCETFINILTFHRGSTGQNTPSPSGESERQLCRTGHTCTSYAEKHTHNTLYHHITDTNYALTVSQKYIYFAKVLSTISLWFLAHVSTTSSKAVKRTCLPTNSGHLLLW